MTVKKPVSYEDLPKLLAGEDAGPVYHHKLWGDWRPPKMTATMTTPPGQAIRNGWYLFWTGLWQIIRHPRSRPGVTFTFWERER